MRSATKEITLTYKDISTRVNLRKSSKARRVSIKIDHNKQVELIVPYLVSVEQAQKFLIAKQSWIFNKLKKLKDPEGFAESDVIPIFGVRHKIIHNFSQNNISITMENNLLKVNCSTGIIKKVLTEFLKDFFLNEVTKIAESMSKEMKLSFKKIRISNATTKWGSCSANKTLSFNWRLVFAPREIVTYVVIHEIAHLKEMNHSKAFWELVKFVDADFMVSIEWLKEHRSVLHSFL